ncbi:MAG: citrate/2-methylcitrate synthase, partial [Desulfobacterales bacterium]
MEVCQPILNTGLRGFKVATTRISDIDGTIGRLIYRGYLVPDLAGKVSFEEVAYLLLYEQLPNKRELEDFKKQLVSERSIPSDVIAALKTRPKDALSMDILQAGVALLSHYDSDTKEYSREAAIRMGIKLIAKFPTVVAAWGRIRKNKEPVDPNPELDHAANFLYMLNGTIPDDELSSFLDTALVLHAEHSFNASTFSARQVASTKAHMYSAVAAAVGSLSGELHGGANARVMQMLLNIGTVDKVEEYVNHLLDTGGKIMGLGHAVYKTDDPRAHILAPMSKKMGERTGELKWYEMSKLL